MTQTRTEARLASAEGSLAAMHALNAVTHEVHASLDLATTLDAVAHGVIAVSGFGIAVVNLVVEDGAFAVVAVAGSEEVARAMLGTVEPAATWHALMRDAEHWGELRFVSHEHDVITDGMHSWVPDLDVADDPRAWHPHDALLVPLLAPDGSVIGALSVDEPEDGERPGPGQQEILTLFARQAAIAIEHSRVHDRLQATAADLAASNARLEAANRIQADLVGLISHDARQPLSVVSMLNEELLDAREHLSEDEQTWLLQRSQRAVRDLGDLFDDVLAMLRAETGGLGLEPRPTPVRATVAQCVTGCASAHPTLAGTTVLGDDEAQVDPRILRHVVTNLLTNAAKYGAAPYVVTVGPAGRGMVGIRVRDHGPGVPAEQQPRLFQRFARGRHPGVRGSGFGLYIVQRLVEASGGQVGYHDADPGSEFEVVLPAAQAAGVPVLRATSWK